MALEATETDNVPAYKIWLHKIKCLWGDEDTVSPGGKRQVFTVAEPQLNSYLPGEEELGKAERIWAFPRRKEQTLCRGVGRGSVRAVGVPGAAHPSSVLYCEEAEAEKFIQLTSIYILCSCI